MLSHSLLDEGLFHACGAGGTVACLSLPALLARLSAGEDLAFTALRPHQRAPWHAFLVQLAYLALEDDPSAEPPSTPAEWQQRLRALTPHHADDAPWCLVNTDWQQPAFLQAPCSPDRVANFKRTAEAAQDIDVLVTARHHDEKTGKLPLQAQALDVLVYALVLLQGWSPFLGVGNYNTMRMNGGFSSRPQVRLAFARGTGPEFLRDLGVLRGARRELAAQFAARHPGAEFSTLHRLLWLPPWDEGSLPLSGVHPLCLEICRRVRLVREQGRLQLRRASSNAMRVAARDRQGNVMDPWVPIVTGGEAPKALTAQAHSLGYRSLQSLLFDRSRIQRPLLAEPTAAELLSGQPATWVAHVLVSGDGGTDGLLRRELPLPAAVLAQMSTAPDALAGRSQRFVALAGVASGKVLRSALLQFVDASAVVEWKNRDFMRAVEPWVDLYEKAIDEVFFDMLFDSIEHDLDDTLAQRRWVAWLAQAARAHLALAAQALPTRDGSRQFARARAERFLRLSLRKQFAAWLPSAAAVTAATTAAATAVAADATGAEAEDPHHA